jgi:hypothetical protein
MYGCDIWSMTEKDKITLTMTERNVLRKVYRTNWETGLKKTGAGSECDQNG